jgi:hypothetical protein
MEKLETFSPKQMETVNNGAAMAEELVSDFYKMSASQWLRPKYDIKTLVHLSPDEIVHGPFAQIIRYGGKRKDSPLGSSAYDYYKICLQDQTILSTLKNSPQIKLFPFILYIVTHELIHIVRFSKFLQHFNASDEEMVEEEGRVHEVTRELLSVVRISGMKDVLKFYEKWRL